MRTTRIWRLVVLLGPLGGLALAQAQDYQDPREEGRVPQEVFLLNDRIIDLAIDRIVDGMVGQYELDEDQVWLTKEAFKRRIPDWIAENRGEIVSVMNQYFETLLGADPPAPEEVAQWADRAKPLLEKFSDLVTSSTDEMHEFYTPEQSLILDGEMAVFKVGKGHVANRLEVWSQGGYDWETEWIRSPKFREAQTERERTLHAKAAREKAVALGHDLQQYESGGGAPGAESRLAADMESKIDVKNKESRDELTAYVEAFIKRYQLKEDQQNSARRILRSVQAGRDRYLARKLDDIERLHERLKKSTSPEEREEVRKAFDELNRPLERYFQQLKDRLERLPTRKQRAEAARREMQTTPVEEAKPTPTPD
jgi:hypothetical protein